MLAALQPRLLCRGLATLVAVAAVSACGSAGNQSVAEKIVVQGASGNLGGLVIEELLSLGVQPENLILVSRTPEKLRQYADMGASTRFGDFTAPESLRAAYAGGTRMLLISMGGGGGRRAELQAGAIDAAVEAGVEHIAYTSYINADMFLESAIAPDHRATEAYLRDSGIAWTMLRNSIYMDGLVEEAAAAIRAGELITSTPDARLGYVTRADCAAAAAAVIAGPGHENRVYDITGPELIGPEEIAATAAAVGGHPIQYTVLTQAQHVAALVAAGQTESAARGAIGFQGELNSPYLRLTSDAIENLTGRRPTSLRDLLEANAAQLRAAVP